MSATFEELDRRSTRIGDISLRRRVDPASGGDVYEVKLGDEFLMSSLFTVSEIALATLGLGALSDAQLDVVVGGLGLGYTAKAVLADTRVRSLRVIEALREVIEWHEDRLLPVSGDLVGDPRCHLVGSDFFAAIAGAAPLGPGAPAQWHAILVDIDHSPRRHLHPSHSVFYELAGLAQVAARLHPGGVFALWSDDPPDRPFCAVVEAAIGPCTAHVVAFQNPYTESAVANTVYVAAKSATS